MRVAHGNPSKSVLASGGGRSVVSGLKSHTTTIDHGWEVPLLTDHRPRPVTPPEGNAPVSPVLPGRGELILVVEDDDTLRPAIARLLLNIGFSVLTAENGMEALAVVDACPQKIDLVLTDVVMPDLDGPGLVKRLASRGLHPAVVYMSGYTDPTVLARVPTSPSAPILVKPFTLQALVRVLGEVLTNGA